MNKSERELWRELATVEAFILPNDEGELYPSSLCNFCQFAWFMGDCYDAELICRHPLDERIEVNYNTYSCRSHEVWAGDWDCFLFRPKVPFDIAVEYVGQHLQGLDVRLPTKEELIEVG